MQNNDWFFDVIMDLCEKAEQCGMTAMSAKLEEALDAFLEDQGHVAKPEPRSAGRVVSMGPISLGEDSFEFGSRRRPSARPAPLLLRSPRHVPVRAA